METLAGSKDGKLFTPLSPPGGPRGHRWVLERSCGSGPLDMVLRDAVGHHDGRVLYGETLAFHLSFAWFSSTSLLLSPGF